MRVRKNIATNEEGFIFNPATGDSFSTNEIGVEIINQLRNEVPEVEIINLICSKYDVDKMLFERDFEDFMMQLKEFNILD